MHNVGTPIAGLEAGYTCWQAPLLLTSGVKSLTLLISIIGRNCQLLASVQHIKDVRCYHNLSPVLCFMEWPLLYVTFDIVAMKPACLLGAASGLTNQAFRTIYPKEGREKCKLRLQRTMEMSQVFVFAEMKSRNINCGSKQLNIFSIRKTNELLQIRTVRFLQQAAYSCRVGLFGLDATITSLTSQYFTNFHHADGLVNAVSFWSSISRATLNYKQRSYYINDVENQ